MRPLKLSQMPFCIGLPGAMKCQAIRFSLVQAEHGVRGELGAVVGDDHRRPAAAGDEGRELSRDPPARDRGVGDRGEALLGHVVDDVQDAEAPAAGELVVDEVDRPARVRQRSAGAAAPARRSPACGLVAAAPSTLPRDRAAASSCGSAPGPPGAAARAAAGSRSAGARLQAPASGPASAASAGRRDR